MRHIIRVFIKTASETLPIQEPIYEFGSFQVPGQESLANLRGDFPGKEYVGCDRRSGNGVDIVLDLHGINLRNDIAGTVLCLDTLEHVEFPHLALKEIYRILKPNGVCIISSVMKFAIHDYPEDYWRFTPQGFKSLLRPFQYSFVDFKGDARFPDTVIGVGVKGPEPKEMGDFAKKIEIWKTLKR